MSSLAAKKDGSPTKKRKHGGGDDAARKAKKARKHRDKDKDKDARREFTHVEASLVVAVPPVFAAAPAQGVEEMLDSMLMRYIPPLRGVVLAHSDMRFLDATAEIQGDSPFAVCRVAFNATVWSPRVGQRLTGHITLSSPDHVALLVHRTFNASIPAAHVPRDTWEFVPGGAADEDVEMPGGAADEDVEMPGGAADEDVEMPAGEEEVEEEAGEDDTQTARTPRGRWVDKHTGSPLGGREGTLAFTVVRLTIANQMLSVVGSIQPNPFAPTHQNPVEEDEPPEPEPELPAEADIDLDDPFAALGRSTDIATQRTEREKKKHKKRDAEGGEGEKPRKKDKHRDKSARKKARKEES